MNSIDSSSDPLTNQEVTRLCSGLLKIPEIAELPYDKYNVLLDKLCATIPYARAKIDWKPGTRGRRPSVESHVLMSDVESALVSAGVETTAWYAGRKPDGLPEMESTLFQVYRVVAEMAKVFSPSNLKPVKKNSGHIDRS